MARPRTPTILDIAAEAGVSKSAVSRALLGQGNVSPENRRRIEAAAKRLGYVANAMARSLVSSRTRTIGVVLRDVKKPYYAYLQAAMQAQAERRDYRIVATTNAGELEVEDALREIRNLISLQVDGLVIAPARLPTSDFASFLERVPIVVAGRQETTRGLSSVACDDVDGGHALADHLLSLGHRKIAVILVDESYSVRYHTRGNAMIQRIESAGGTAVALSAPKDLDSGMVVSLNLDDLDATAIMCPTDAAAMDVLEVIREHGTEYLDRYSVTGYDGYGPLASPYIGLSTFRTPQEEIGRTAIDLLVDQIEGNTDHDRFVSLRGAVAPGRTARMITRTAVTSSV
jgi:DNA-binding LacI/PurR family transcriptional regulator